MLSFALIQAERHYAQGGSHATFESRYRNRGSLIPTTLSPHTRRLRSELNNGHSGYLTDTTQSGTLSAHVDTNYNKEFYSYTAPEEDLNDIEAAQRLASTIRKNLRVVFIKAPENNGLTNAALQLAKQNAETKTAIYVLTKQPDIAELVNQLQSIQPSRESKPEVHFVKYRTPEDAVNAQQIIQHEYDLLGGTSRGINRNIAAVLDFASKKDDLTSNENVNSGTMNRVAVMLNSYLPSKGRQ